jgi:hypothetical protein
MAAHATLADIEPLLMRNLTEVEVTLTEVQLQLAQATLRMKIPGLEARMDLEPDFALLVRNVEASAIVRMIRNPDGTTYEVIGPFARTRPASADAGSFAFLPSELAQLGVTGGAFTIVPYMAPPELTWDNLPPWYQDFPTGAP